MATETKLLNKGKTPFLKTDFAKMGGTALLTSLIFLAIIFSSEIADIFKPKQNPLFANDPISEYTMDTLRKNYQTGEYPIKKLNGTKVDTLDGFVFTKDALKEILLHNKVKSSFLSSKKADAIIFYIGQDGTFQDDKDPSILRPNYKIIGIGITQQGTNSNLILPPNPNRDVKDGNITSIYDKAKPCPGMGCPPPPPPHE
ncbi:MAG: hypothetical protein WAU24_13530 [Chitinophagaceae bacterium]